jgi:altronate dehydratase
MKKLMKLKDKFIIADLKDNVATARAEVDLGTVLTSDEGVQVTTKENIPFGHKIALKDISKDEPIIKYGQRIGIAISNISTGELVHTKNLAGERGRGA